MVGGTTAAARNIIAGSDDPSVFIADAGSSGNLVEGDFIGTNVSGTAGIANAGAGVALASGASGNTIGGLTGSGEGNLISGNTYGITDSGAGGNLFEGNMIGTQAGGSVALANTSGGILIESGANGDTIGGTAAGAGNLISGNTGDGVDLESGTADDLVAGNWIGSDAAGTIALGNSGDGVYINQASGITIGGTSATSANLISGNSNGVEINDASSNAVEGNLIGTDTTGTLAIGNTGAGVLVDAGSSGNTIGGPVGGARNFISGNAEGVKVTDAATTGTLIAGNLIGTDIEGTGALANRTAGIDIAGGTGTTIGGTGSLALNVISGNSGDGIDVGGGAIKTLVQGNFIGTDQTGTQPLPNSGSGVSIANATGVTLGATAQAAGNVISGNTKSGVLITGIAATGVQILGNRIGTDYTGELPLGNVAFGVMTSGAAGVTIGGTATGYRNIISANTEGGIGLYADTTGTLVEGNLIGIDVTGSVALGNGNGIQLDGGSSANTIGGTGSGAGNTIAFSKGIGVDVDATAGPGNEIRLNSIFSNTGLGIDLGGDGITLNNSVAYTGPNNHQNFPVLTNVTSAGGMTTVTGTFNSTPGTTFELDFYTLSTLNASGYGEGRFLLGSASVTTDVHGNFNFNFQFPTPAGGARFVTAMATDPNGNSSEFSQQFGVDTPPQAVIGFNAITVNAGALIPFDGLGSTDPSGNPLTYSWSFGDGATATGPEPSHTYSKTGTDTVTLTVDDGFGGVSTAMATVTVQDVAPVFTPNSFTPPVSFSARRPAMGSVSLSPRTSATWRSARRGRTAPASSICTTVYRLTMEFPRRMSMARSSARLPIPTPSWATNLARRWRWSATSWWWSAGQLAIRSRQRGGVRFRCQCRQHDVRRAACHSLDSRRGCVG